MNARPNHFIIKEPMNGHHAALLSAVRKGKERVRKKIEKKQKQDALIKSLLEQANQINKQVASYDTTIGKPS